MIIVNRYQVHNKVVLQAQLISSSLLSVVASLCIMTKVVPELSLLKHLLAVIDTPPRLLVNGLLI
jgi:hypothetical protein